MQELVQDEETNRLKTAKTIEPKMLKVYERNRGPRSRRIALMRKDSWGVLQTINATKAQRSRRCERVVNCENCGAIVVWNEMRLTHSSASGERAIRFIKTEVRKVDSEGQDAG